VDLVGKLVKLRALRPDDAETLVANAADPEFGRYLGGWSWIPYSVEDAREFIARRDPARVTWAVEVLEDATCIGTAGLQDLDFRNRHCYWGIGIGPPNRWGQGYGTEACILSVRFAFRQLGMEKVYLQVHQGNERGRRAYEKAGFSVEGTLPRNQWLEGGLVTTYLMAAYRDGPLYS
jgi:RimJ/RimL family protein N-acetyltransferase